MAQRAYWEQTNRHGQVDRIELHDSEYGGASPELQFKGDKTGFTRQWDEITSESNDKLINIQANRIQIGKYDFRPRIENQTGFDILEDIRDSDNKRFHIVHKIDGVFEWAGWVTTRIFSYPEKDNNFFAHIRATDFEILKGIDYSLTDTRQTFITTFANLFSELPKDTPIKTATSWVEENVTARVGNETYDFLDEIRHETKALRDFGRTGDETDQPITKWEALEHVAEPGLLIRQMGGHVMIDQLTDLADPTAVNETVYDSTGSVTTATQSVDRRQTGYATADNGTPSIKNVSQNETYPAVKRAKNKFDHRTGVNNIQFPDLFELDSGNTSAVYSQFFVSDGTQEIFLSGKVEGFFSQGYDDVVAPLIIRVDTGSTVHYYDTDSGWGTSFVANNIELNNTGRTSPQGVVHQAYFNITTDPTPNGADGSLEIEVRRAESLSSGFADNTQWRNMVFDITNAIASENSTSINYQLTQDSFDAPEIITLDDTWFGDGPIGYSTAALRFSANDGDTTADSWRRRGQTIDYRNYHWNLLAEVIDMGRTNMRKLEADIWGAYDPTKVLDYNGSYFYFAGGKYDGTRGKWRVTLMELNLQTGSDTFDDIPKFTDETGSGSGSTSSGGGGVDQDTGDARWVNKTGDSMSGNLDLSGNDLQNVENFTGNAIGSDLQAHSSVLDNVSDNNATADLDLNSLAINGDDLFSIFYTESEIDSFFDLYYSKADLTDGDEDLHLNSLEVESGKFLSPTSYQFRNAGDTDFRDVEMGGLTANGEIRLPNDIATDGSEGYKLRLGKSTGSYIAQVQQGSDSDQQGIVFYTHPSGTSSDPAELAMTLNRDKSLDLENGLTDLYFPQSYQSLNEPFIEADRYNSSTNILNVGEHDLLGDAGSFGGLMIHSVFRSIGLSTESAGFDNVTQLALEVDINNDTQVFGNLTAKSNLLSDDFNNDTWAGNGYRGTNAGDWVVENLRVRNALEVYEFVAKQISSVGGKEILSIANGRIESVNAGANEIEVQDVRGQNATSFEAGDLWIVQVTDINNDLESGGTGSIVRSVRGSVTSVSGATLTVSVDSGSLSDLEENDLIVAYGSSNSDRNAIMYRNVDRSDDNLIMRMQTGVTSFSALTDPANTSVAYGDLNGYLGISSEEFGFFAGDVSGNYILATENQVNAKLDDLKLDVIGGGSSGFTNADFFLDASAHQMSLGSVFSADGGADTGTLAGLDFDGGALVTGDGSLGSYTAGTVTGLQPRASDSTKTFFSGADNQDGDNASFYVEADGSLSTVGSSGFKIFEVDVPNDKVEIGEVTPGGSYLVFDNSSLTGYMDKFQVNNKNVTGTGATSIPNDDFAKIGELGDSQVGISIISAGNNTIGIFTHDENETDKTVEMFDPNNNFTAQTGTPTGTTGPLTNGGNIFTNASGEIYIENRSGATINFTHTILSDTS